MNWTNILGYFLLFNICLMFPDMAILRPQSFKSIDILAIESVACILALFFGVLVEILNELKRLNNRK